MYTIDTTTIFYVLYKDKALYFGTGGSGRKSGNKNTKHNFPKNNGHVITLAGIWITAKNFR